MKEICDKNDIFIVFRNLNKILIINPNTNF